jgi:hypothetical protein
MKYRLVLQWPTSPNIDYEMLVAIQDLLRMTLDASDDVNGHDAGLQTMNILINTNELTQIKRHRLETWSEALIDTLTHNQGHQADVIENERKKQRRSVESDEGAICATRSGGTHKALG